LTTAERLDGTSGNIDNFQIFGSNLVNPALADNGSTVFLLASGSESSPGGAKPTRALRQLAGERCRRLQLMPK
jgi:hypothetical protein